MKKPIFDVIYTITQWLTTGHKQDRLWIAFGLAVIFMVQIPLIILKGDVVGLVVLLLFALGMIQLKRWIHGMVEHSIHVGKGGSNRNVSLSKYLFVKNKIDADNIKTYSDIVFGTSYIFTLMIILSVTPLFIFSTHTVMFSPPYVYVLHYNFWLIVTLLILDVLLRTLRSYFSYVENTKK